MNNEVRAPGAITLFTFAIGTTLGGANFIAVRFSNRELPPFWGAGLRFGIAAALFVAFVLIRRLPWPRGETLRANIIYGALSFAINYALLYWALVRVEAGIATIVLAIVPLMTLLLASMQGTEKLAVRGVIGALLSLAGIAWMTFGPRHITVPLDALIAILLGAVVISQSMILGKRLSGNHPAMTNAVGMTVGALMLLVFSALVGERWALPQSSDARWALAYLVTLGSAGLFVTVLLVVRRWTASASSYMFVLFPVVTLALAAWLADEPVTRDAIIGAALVMAGVWFGALSPAARRAANAPTAPSAPSGPLPESA